jgi:microcystin-dependent protein
VAIQFTPRLAGPYPESADPAVVPSDIHAVVQWVEDLLATGGGDPLAGWSTGDVKLSVRDDDHGRWLRCDGRALTQAEVETALGLDAGEADAFVAVLGTGAGSKYGAAAAGKVKLPDPRASMLMGAGAAGDHPGGLSDRALGSQGGEETVTLTARQSGLVGHNHTVNDPGHTHVITDPGHAHGVVDPTHTHGPGSADPGAVGTMNNFWGDFAGFGGIGVAAGGSYPVWTASRTGSSGTGVSISSTSTGISVVTHSTGVTNTAVADTAARDAHDNMSPFTTIGYAFLRV